MIILNKILKNSRLGHNPLIVAFEEKPSLVAEYPGFEDEYSWQRSRDFVKRIHHRVSLNRIH